MFWVEAKARLDNRFACNSKKHIGDTGHGEIDILDEDIDDRIVQSKPREAWFKWDKV